MAEQTTLGITSIYDAIDYVYQSAKSERQTGDMFERVCAYYLRSDPQLSQVVSKVWLWDDNPLLDGQDTGIDLVAGVLEAVENDGIVGVVLLRKRLLCIFRYAESRNFLLRERLLFVFRYPEPRNPAEMLSVGAAYGLSAFDICIMVAKIDQPHRGVKFTHLCVGADACDCRLVHDAEILEFIEPLTELRGAVAYCASLHRVKDFCRVKTENGSIPEGPDSAAMSFDAECVGRIVNDFKTVGLRNFVDRVDITYISVDVDRQDRAGAVCDEILDF